MRFGEFAAFFAFSVAAIRSNKPVPAQNLTSGFPERGFGTIDKTLLPCETVLPGFAARRLRAARYDLEADYEAPTSCKALPLVSSPMVKIIRQAIQKKAAMVMKIP